MNKLKFQILFIWESFIKQFTFLYLISSRNFFCFVSVNYLLKFAPVATAPPAKFANPNGAVIDCGTSIFEIDLENGGG